MTSKLLKLERFKSFFDCRFCSSLLKNPITLPCGSTICQIHIDEILFGSCTFCNAKHELPEGGSFQINTLLAEMLELEVDKIELSPKFNACKGVIEETKTRVDSIEALYKDPAYFIYEYFEDIKRKVDYRREDLKIKIDVYSGEIINKVNETQAYYKSLASQTNHVSDHFEEFRTELNTLACSFDSFKIDDEKYEEIQTKVTAIKPKFDEILEELKGSLIGNNYHEFKFKEIDVKDVFGTYISIPKNYNFRDSKILDKQNVHDLINLCEFSKDQRWKLIYRASEDGFGASQFHAKCDGIQNNLVVIKSHNENIFGGYTTQAWNQSGTCGQDSNAFIFSLVNKESNPFKAKCIKPANSIFCGAKYGPIFGGGNDIHISTNSNINQISYANFGQSYSYPIYPLGSNQAKSILAGSYNFQTIEIEVYCKEGLNLERNATT